MRYQYVAGQPDVILWMQGDDSGIITDGNAGWPEYQAWLSAGNVPEPPPEQWVTQETAMAMVDREFELACSPLRGSYPQAEIDSWAQQAAEAKAFIANPTAQTPLLDGLMLPWEEKESFCCDVIERADAYSAAMGEILMWRRIAVAAVEAMFADGPRARFHVQYPSIPSVD